MFLQKLRLRMGWGSTLGGAKPCLDGFCLAFGLQGGGAPAHASRQDASLWAGVHILAHIQYRITQLPGLVTKPEVVRGTVCVCVCRAMRQARAQLPFQGCASSVEPSTLCLLCRRVSETVTA